MPLAASASPASAPPHAPDLPGGDVTAAEKALVASPHLPEGAKIKLTAPLARLPVELEVAVPVRDFRVRHLLVLEPGQVIETQWAQGTDMPLSSGDVQLAWSEFEVVDSQLAVRVTRLA
jgi:flagellar motor switch/type III secretory pathway protein FliN